MAASDTQSSYRILMDFMPSLTKLDGRRPKSKTQRDRPATAHGETSIEMEGVLWLPKGSVDVPRFEIPIDVRVLSNLTPVQYLTKYCIITSRVKKLLYHRHYSKYREMRADGIDTLDKMKKAIKDVCTFSVNSTTHCPSDSSLNYYVHGILRFDLDEQVKVNFKSFLGIAALAERIFNPNYMSSWIVNEKRLEEDYQLYKSLREQEEEAKERLRRKLAEQQKQQSQKAEMSSSARNRLLKGVALDPDDHPKAKSNAPPLDTTESEEQLSQEIQEKRYQLENKISITKILELESRPNRCPKEVTEQADFHGLKWKLNGVTLSPYMQRLIKIIINL